MAENSFIYKYTLGVVRVPQVFIQKSFLFFVAINGFYLMITENGYNVCL